MTREQYLSQRNALFAKCQELLNAGDIDSFNTAKAEIEALDAKYTAEATAAANLNVLRHPVNTIIDVSQLDGVSSVPVAGTLESLSGAGESADGYAAAFGKYMLGLALNAEEQAAFDLENAAQTTGDHSLVIPETYVAGIWQEIGERHPILADTVKTFVKGDLTIITGSSGDNATWYDEATSVADSAVTTGSITLKGYELAKAITVSWKLKTMAIDDFMAYLTRAIAEKMSDAMAAAVAVGKGVPAQSDTSFKAQPEGIVTALEAETGGAHIVTYTDSDPLSYAKLTAAMSKMKSGYSVGASIYAKSATVWNTLANLLDEMGRPLFVPDVTGGGVGRMFGLPVKEEDAIPDGGILMGNVAKGYLMNINQNIQIYTENHAKPRTTDYVAVAILDGRTKTEEAFAYIKKETE